MATTYGVLVQIVSTSRGIVLDIQAENTATDGRTHKCHAVAKLALDEAMKLETTLQQAIDAAWDYEGPTEFTDTRQTSLWSPSVFTAPVRRAA